MRKTSRLKAEPDGRQIVPLSIKLSAPLERLILEIGGANDRGKSYVVRELMRRGLTLYQQDGQIKPNCNEEQVLAEMIENDLTGGKPEEPFNEKPRKNAQSA